MTPEETTKTVEAMLRDFSIFTTTLGGLEFYGHSADFHDLLCLCRDLASRRSTDEIASGRKAYLFIDSRHGKSSIARATEMEAKSSGLSAYRFDGTVGATQRELRGLRPEADAIVLVDGVPEAAGPRRTLLECFNSLDAKGLLFAPPEYFADANLDSNVPRLRLNHVDQRPIDKLAWLVGLVREHLRGDNGLVSATLFDALAQLPARALITLSSATLGAKITELPALARSIAEALRLSVGLEPGGVFPQEELAVIFMEFYSPAARQSTLGFRLWVEGESDCRILKLVARLVRQAREKDLEEGLFILPLGEGREGGTSRATEVVMSQQTRRNKDVFLLDFDDPGKNAKEALRILQQDVLLLDPRISCSRSDSDVEIEDFISLSCLDRFYGAYPDLRPEKEIVRYKIPATRRIVVDGVDKETLVNWLDSNASLTDLENLFYLLCEIRGRFSLKNLLSVKELHGWRKKLEEEFNSDKHVGKRPLHWSH